MHYTIAYPFLLIYSHHVLVLVHWLKILVKRAGKIHCTHVFFIIKRSLPKNEN